MVEQKTKGISIESLCTNCRELTQVSKALGKDDTHMKHSDDSSWADGGCERLPWKPFVMTQEEVDSMLRGITQTEYEVEEEKKK